MSLATLGVLWLWATLAGLDLVSVMQTLLSRPLVAGAVTGWLVGDVESGLRIGAVLELFALDVVPVGSAKYPDFGAATVAAVVYGSATDWTITLGASVGLGVALASIAGLTIPVTRRLTARVVRSQGARLAEGDPAAIRAVHLTGLAHDLIRSGVAATIALTASLTMRALEWWPGPGLGGMLTNVALAGAAWALAHGAVASARTGPRWRWAATGLVAGSLVAWQR
jgi:mannose/fructose/N-acetylgalactosamine-specific phosphotransferase system component IIC